MLNEKELDFLGILNWHKKGYKGRNIVIASRENVLPDYFDNIEAYQFESKHSEWAKHGTNVMDFINQVAPEARKLTFEFHGSNKEIFTSPHSKYIQDIIPDVLTTSLFGGEHRGTYADYFKRLYDSGTFLCCAAGNDGNKGLVQLSNGDMWKAIGACRYNKGKIVIDTQFDSVKDFHEGLAAVLLYGKWGFINKTCIDKIIEEINNFKKVIIDDSFDIMSKISAQKSHKCLNNHHIINKKCIPNKIEMHFFICVINLVL